MAEEKQQKILFEKSELEESAALPRGMRDGVEIEKGVILNEDYM